MIHVHHAKSVRRLKWQRFCKSMPRVMDAGRENLHLAFNAGGFSVCSPRANVEAEIACAFAVLDALDEYTGLPVLRIYTLRDHAGVN